jgi:hypothetical protein
MALHLMTTEVEEERDTYRLVVFNEAGSGVLLQCQGSEYHLPSIEIPRFTRPAQQITGFLRDCQQTSSVLLFFGALGEDPSADHFAVLYTYGKASLVQEGINWFPVHDACETMLTREERRVLELSYIKAYRSLEASVGEPFSRLGWMRDLQEWVQSLVEPLGSRLRGFEQINGNETFSLIRFDTTIRPVWFKAVGEPHLHEFSITMGLARLFPEYLPTVLASRSDCHGWLMDDADGIPLDQAADVDACECAASTLASLQIESINTTDDLVQMGCGDLRITTLLELVDLFFDLMGELMLRQKKVPPPPLAHHELAELGRTLKDSLRFLAALNIPETLGHGDFNPGNIMVAENRCVFIDWAEAHVGHPFFTLEHLLSHLWKDRPDLTVFEGSIRTAYAKRWESTLSAQVIASALVFSPLAAVFGYAVACGIWPDSGRLKDPVVAGYLRSLTRRMKREADLIPGQRVECLN